MKIDNRQMTERQTDRLKEVKNLEEKAPKC